MLKIIAQSIVDAHTVASRIWSDRKFTVVEDTSIDLDEWGYKIYHVYECEKLV